MDVSLIGGIFGLIGAAVGTGGTILANYVTHRLGQKRQGRINEARKSLLKEMLTNAEGKGFMTLVTLARVVGADEETAKLLLLEIGARGNQLEKETWTLISRNPLPK